MSKQGASSPSHGNVLEAVLARARDQAAARLAAAEHDFDEIVAAASHANADDEHDPEGATIAYERSRVAAQRDQAAASLAAIDAQAQRLRQGTLTICEVCGSEIPLERIVAIVTTRRCVACAGAS